MGYVDLTNEKVKLGSRMQYYREVAKVTQKEMAEACGVTKNYISAVERGINICTATIFISYAIKCGISLDVLAGLTETESISA